MAEGQSLFNTVFVALADGRGFAERTAALGAFASQQMPAPGAAALYFSRGRDFESLGHRLPRLDTLWTSHKS